jgi:hypothetical protein
MRRFVADELKHDVTFGCTLVSVGEGPIMPDFHGVIGAYDKFFYSAAL